LTKREKVSIFKGLIFESLQELRKRELDRKKIKEDVLIKFECVPLSGRRISGSKRVYGTN
jgi:hypothetical protein